MNNTVTNNPFANGAINLNSGFMVIIFEFTFRVKYPLYMEQNYPDRDLDLKILPCVNTQSG